MAKVVAAGGLMVIHLITGGKTRAAGDGTGMLGLMVACKIAERASGGARIEARDKLGGKRVDRGRDAPPVNGAGVFDKWKR